MRPSEEIIIARPTISGRFPRHARLRLVSTSSQPTAVPIPYKTTSRMVHSPSLYLARSGLPAVLLANPFLSFSFSSPRRVGQRNRSHRLVWETGFGACLSLAASFHLNRLYYCFLWGFGRSLLWIYCFALLLFRFDCARRYGSSTELRIVSSPT